MKENELKPCPFCGGEAVTHECGIFENETAKVIFGDRVGVHCSVCNVATLPFNDETQAIEAWNRRANSEQKKQIEGEWIYHIDDLFPEDSTQECSICHEVEYLTLCNENYCPNCGAKMKGRQS